MNASNPNNSSNRVILLTVDVEDWFQVENLKSAIPFESWPTRELRVERNTHRILDLFDEMSGQRSAFREPQGPEPSRRAVSGQRSSGQKTVDQVTETEDPSTSLRAGSRQETVGQTQTPTSDAANQRVTDNGERITALSQRITVNGEQLTTPGQRITDNGEHRPADLPPQAQRSSSEVYPPSAAPEATRAIFHPPTSGPVASALNNKSSESCKSCLTSPSPLITNNGQLITDNGQHEKVRGTFFVLGWLAERLPHLVREIQARGHEVASHGYSHELCSECSIDDLKEDLAKSKKLLEDIIGARVYGYRAPSFSISDDILKMIADAGYLYDSSYNSFAMHSRYGKISLNGNRRSGIAILLNQKSKIKNQKFYELPISNLVLSFGLNNPSNSSNPSNLVLPWGGGAYFRLIPAVVFRMGVRAILRRQQAYLFYVHPWEVDPDQPRPEGTAVFSRFKHYTNLSRTEGKLRNLLEKFNECSFVTCHDHLERDELE